MGNGDRGLVTLLLYECAVNTYHFFFAKQFPEYGRGRLGHPLPSLTFVLHSIPHLTIALQHAHKSSYSGRPAGSG